VLDCEQQTFLHSLSDLPGVVGVLVDEEHHLLFTSDRAAARVSVFGEPGVVCSFDSEQPALLETVETERGAHTTGWDPIDQCLHVFCPGSGGAAVYEERA